MATDIPRHHGAEHRYWLSRIITGYDWVTGSKVARRCIWEACDLLQESDGSRSVAAYLFQLADAYSSGSVNPLKEDQQSAPPPAPAPPVSPGHRLTLPMAALIVWFAFLAGLLIGGLH